MAEGNGRVYLDAAQIFATKLPVTELYVPEWDGTVRVRGLSAQEAEEIGNLVSRGKAENIAARIVALAIIDEHGNRVFGDGDVERLGHASFAAIRRIRDAAQVLSGLIDGQALEEAQKNSVTAPSVDLPSA